jgi:hypothetical protein
MPVANPARSSGISGTVSRRTFIATIHARIAEGQRAAKGG